MDGIAARRPSEGGAVAVVMQGHLRAFVFASSSWLLVAAAGCGSRSALVTGTGETDRVTGASPDAAVLGNDAGADATGCAADPLLCIPHIVLFGGFDVDHNMFLDDTWEWNGAAWTQRNAQGPSARAGHAMATLDGKVVLFGGGMTSALIGGDMLEGPTLDDTWEWDGTSWTQRTVAAHPAARSGHAMATLDGKVVMFGGGIIGQGPDPAETWVWDGKTWTVAATTGPPARTGHTMTAVGDRVVLFGGADATGRPLYDLWTWDGTRWTTMPTYGAGGVIPVARYGHAAAALGGKLWICGGYGYEIGLLDDLWSWDFSLWVSGPEAPSPREAVSMATLGSTAVLFGGATQGRGSTTNAEGSTYAWAGFEWAQDVGGPPPRAESAMATQ